MTVPSPDEIERVVDHGIEASVERLLDTTAAPELSEPAARRAFVSRH